MTIPLRQLRRKVTKALASALKTGLPLSQDTVRSQMSGDAWVSGRPTMESFLQQYKGTLDVDAHNTLLENLEDDLTILYEDYQALLKELMRRIASAEAVSDMHIHRIRTLESTINDLILLSSGTDIGMVVTDDFLDMTKIDQSQSDVGLDMQGGFVSLCPIPGSARLPLLHLGATRNPGVSIENPKTEIHEMSGRFGDAVNDTAAGWVFTVKSQDGGQKDLHFDIPLTQTGDPTPRISRIDFAGHAFSPFQIKIFGSSDGTNYTYFDGYPDFEYATERRVTMVFPSRRVKYLRISMRRHGPDGQIVEEGNPLYTYSFGLKTLGIYEQGYAKQSTLMTKSLEPTGVSVDRPIDKVTVVADEVLPNGTDIEYFLSADGGTSWAEVTPINRKSNLAANMLKLDKPTRTYDMLYSDSTPDLLDTIDGKPFYSLYTFPTEPIPDSVQLTRGEYAWRYEEGSVERRADRLINYISFSKPLQGYSRDGAVQPLYRIEYEELGEHGNSDGVNPTYINLRYPIYPTGTPALTGERESSEEQPHTQVVSITRRMLNTTISSTTCACVVEVETVERDLDQPWKPRLVTLTNFTGIAPTLLYDTTAGRSVYEFVNMKFHYNFTMESGKTQQSVATIVSAVIDGSGNVLLKLDDSENPLIAGTVSSGSWFIPEINIKDTIQNVSGNTISLAAAQPLLTTDIIKVHYKRKLLPNERVIKDSIRAAYRSEAVGRKFDDRDRIPRLEYGRDYKIDGQNIIRMNTGNVRIDPDDEDPYVVVDFKIETAYYTLSSYTTYLYAEGPDTQHVMLDPVTVNTGIGESIKIAGQKVDGVSSLQVKPGWNEVRIKSVPHKNPNGTINRGAAIYRFINAQDTRGRYILPAYRQVGMTGDPAESAFAAYFTKQAAYRNAFMKRTTPHHLTTGIKPDDIPEWFAVKAPSEISDTDESRIMIGYDPSSTSKLLYYPPDVLGTADPETAEMFKISYSFMLSETPVTSMVIKAELSRSGDPHLTPMLKKYTLRFSY